MSAGSAVPLAPLARRTPEGAFLVDERWAGFGGAHGGLLVAMAAETMADVVGADRPLRSIHADLRGAVAPGELAFVAAPDREGRGVSFVGTRGLQGGRERLAATAVFGAAVPEGDDAAPRTYAPSTRAVRPAVPPVDRCSPWSVEGSPALPTVEFRPIGPHRPGGGGSVACLDVWMRIADDDRPVDRARALTLLDAPAPGLFALATELFAIPTVEFTAHLLPALTDATSPWVQARMQTVVASEGWSIDDCELWSEAGDLLATARQLRRLIA